MADLAYRDLRLRRLGRRSASAGGAFLSFPIILSGLTFLDPEYVATTGVQLTAGDAAVTLPGGVTVTSRDYSWLRANDTTIPGATLATYTPPEGEYPGTIRNRQTITLSNGQVLVATSQPYDLALTAPTVVAPIPDQIFVANTGIKTVPLVGVFSRSVGTYGAETLPFGVSIVGSDLVVDTALPAAQNGTPVEIFYEDAGGIIADQFTLSVNVYSGENYTLDNTGSSGLNYSFTPNTIFTAATGSNVDTQGIFMSCFGYYDAVSGLWAGALMSVSVAGAGNCYLALEGNRLVWRSDGGAIVNTTALANPTVSGWYPITGRMRNGATGKPTSKRILEFQRGSTVGTASSSSTNSNTGVALLDCLSIGMIKTPSPFGFTQQEICFPVIGLGDPAAYHAYVLAGNDPRTYNWAGDVNATLLMNTNAARVGPVTLTAGEAALAPDAPFNVPTLTGVPFWTNRPVPFSAIQTAPAQMTATNVTVTQVTSAAGDKLNINYLVPPADGGASITAVQYEVNSGFGFGATQTVSLTPATTEVTVLAVTPATFRFRAINAVGIGAWYTLAPVTPLIANRAPVANPDFADTLQDAQITLSPLGNDTDLDGNPLTITAASSANGTCVINGGATITFTPTTAFTGTATVNYTISDGQGGSASSTVTVSVTAIPTGFILTGPLSFTGAGDTGAASFTSNRSARYYWGLSAPATTPTAAEIAAGTGLLASGFFDADTGTATFRADFPTGISVTNGVLSIVGRVEPEGEWSNVLRDTTVDVNTMPPPYALANHTVTMQAASSDGLQYNVAVNTLFTAARLDAGMFFVYSWYNDGSNFTGAVFSVSDISQLDTYMTFQCGKVSFRPDGATERATSDLGQPAAIGWQTCVAYVKFGVTNPGDGARRIELWRNGVAATPFVDTSTAGIGGPALYNAVTLGCINRSSSDLGFFEGELTEILIGTGRPTVALMNALYNGGAFGVDVNTVNLAALGLTKLEYLPLKAANPTALVSGHAALQGSNGLLVNPTLIGAPAFKLLNPPSEGV